MEQGLRILVVSLEYPPPSLGGYEIMCAQVCEWLEQRGHTLFVLTCEQPAHAAKTEPPMRADALPVRRTLRSYWDGTRCLYPPLLEALKLEQANQQELQQTVAAFRPDVISFWHMGNLSLGLITTAIRLGLPLVFVIGDDWLCYGWWADGWIRRFTQHPRHAGAVERHTGIPTRLPDLATAGMFCFVSDHTRRRAEQIGGWGFSSYAITHPGVSRTEFPRLAHLPDQPWQWRLLWIGRVIEEKGIMTAVIALRLLPVEATLQIVGPVDPSYRHSLERVAEVAGAADRLSFALAARQEVRAYYQQADVTLFTSMIEQEAFGLVPLEAMASGCPVISTCVGGSAEYCRDGVNCVCTPPGDAGALAFAIRQIAAHPALRQRLISGGLQTASRLTLDRQAERIEHCLKTAVKNNDRKR